MLFLKIPRQYNIERFHMYDVTGAILMFQNNEAVAILVFQTKILWELNSLLTQTISFVHINLHRCWPRQ